MTASVAAPPRSRFRRLFRLALGLFLVLAACAAGMWGWIVWQHSRAAASLAEAIAETNRLDPGWGIADIEAKREPVPEERNAATRVLALQPFIPPTFPDPDLVKILSGLDPPTRLTAEQRSALAKSLRSVTPERTQARELANFPAGRLPITYAPGFIASKTRSPDVESTIHLLQYDLLDVLEAGDLPAAVTSWRALFHAARSIGDEPLIVSQSIRVYGRTTVVRLLERLLAQGESDAVTLAALQQLLEDDERQPLFLIAVRGERAGSFESIEMVRGSAATRPILLQLEIAVRDVWAGRVTVDEALAMMPGAIPAQEAALLTAMTELVEIAKLPPQDQGPRLDTWAAESKRLPPLARMLVTPNMMLGVTFRTNHAELRCAIVALAAERFRKAKRRWPNDVHELVASGLLKSASVDPFDGRPLLVDRTADGLAVYANHAADRSPRAGSAGQKSPDGRDLGFQLWDVPHRRRSPSKP